jgi:uncharacterized repeat protein (TIGR01451 family)
MKASSKKNFVKPFLPLGFSLLTLIILLCGLSQAMETQSKVSAAAALRERNYLNSPGYQIDVSVCEQTENLVPNPGFEQGIERPDYWYEGGPCLFSYDDPGPNSDVAAEISASSSRETDCRLYTTMIPVEPGRSYDYSAWIQADLAQGEAYLRVNFWSEQGHEGSAYTTPVTDTQGAWVKVTGSVQVPAGADRARAEPTLPDSSVGSVWFDDIFFGLATCLDINKSAHKEEVAPGDVLTYTIVYSNIGREKATNVMIVETYDEYANFVSAQPFPDMSTNIWMAPELPPGISDTITVVVQVDNDTGERAWLFNDVQIHSDETVGPIYTTIPISINGDGCDIELFLPDDEKTGEPDHPTDYDLTLRNAGACDGSVNLDTTSSLGWEVLITPSPPFTLTSGSSQDVTLSLNVPPYTFGNQDSTSITATLACESCGTVTETKTVTTTVPGGPLTGVFITGPTDGYVYEGYTFTATINPFTATQPVTYLWQATGQDDVVTNTHASNNTVIYTWSEAGAKTITVTATNAENTTVTDTHSVAIDVSVLTRVTINGPTTGKTNVTYTFTADVSPATLMLPTTSYTWWPTPTAGQGSEVTYTWRETGAKTIMVTVTADFSNLVTDVHTITIDLHRIYLSLVLRRWPPIQDIPNLHSIDNSDGDGNYIVQWSSVVPITVGTVQHTPVYTLEEATRVDFGDAVTVYYSGTNTSYPVSGKGPTRYYYRVQACNIWGCSDWSNIESVDVQWEKEPNNNPDPVSEPDCSYANGPLLSDVDYYGHPNDRRDYFSVTLDPGDHIVVNLTHPHNDAQLQLRKSDCIRLVYDTGGPPWQIEYTALTGGTYYISVHTPPDGLSDTDSYTLTATFP